jgi:glycerol-3-phosphate acyltransferase PlsY
VNALLPAAVVVGYLVGALSPATFAARRGGVDLRGIGSGNPGASNVGRALGRRTGIVVAVLDVLKGLLPAAGFGAVDHRAGLLAGFAAVLGHVTSPFLRGRGGKGVATTAGAVLGSQPLWAPVLVVVWLAVLAARRWIALASMSAALSLVVVALVLREDRLWASGLALVVLVRHRANVVTALALRRGEGPAA